MKARVFFAAAALGFAGCTDFVKRTGWFCNTTVHPACFQMEKKMFQEAVLVMGDGTPPMFQPYVFRRLSPVGGNTYVSLVEEGDRLVCYTFREKDAIEFACEPKKEFFSPDRIVYERR